MPEQALSERTRQLLQALSQVPTPDEDKPLLRATPEARQEVLEAQVEVKPSIEEVLQKAAQTDALTGQEVTDTSDLSITNFSTEEVRAMVLEVQDQAKQVWNNLNNLVATIEEKIVGRATSATVTIDLRRNTSLKGAIIRIFGRKTNEITFEMYKQALALRERHKTEDINSSLDDQLNIRLDLGK